MMRLSLIPAFITVVVAVSCGEAAPPTRAETFGEKDALSTLTTVPVGTGVASTLTPSPPGTSVPLTTPVARPADLVVVSGDSRTRLPGFNWCWRPATVETALCADGPGGAVPVSVDSAFVTLEWLVDGTLTLSQQADTNGCEPPPVIEPLGPGLWQLSMPGETGTYRIDLTGTATGGSTKFAMLVTSSVAGPALRPTVEIAWEITQGPLAVAVTVVGLDRSTDAVIEVSSMDDSVSKLVIPLQQAGCLELFGETDIEEVALLGTPPLGALLLIDDGSSLFEFGFRFPDDFVGDGIVRGSMQRTADE